MTEKSDESSVREESSPDMAKRPSGRLELTWANKDKALLSRDDGSYEWVAKRDRRVAEVRLLRDAGTVGEVHPEAERAKDNLLIRGDALHALTALTKLPEFAEEYVGKVKLVYIDPPFNTGQAFEHYDDGIEHSVWLAMMRDRLVQVRRLLSADGSVWVHLDDREAHRCRMLLDEVFGADCFVSEVIWETTDARKMDADQFSLAHNRILVYSKSYGWEPHRYVAETNETDFPLVDASGNRYSRRELRKWGKNSLRTERPNGWYPLTAPDGSEVFPIRPDGREGTWRWQASKVEADADRIEWVKTDRGLEPYVKTYMSSGKKPLPPRTLWKIGEVPGNPAAREQVKALFPDVEPFSTPKPEELLQEILFLGTNEGDIVLDFFSGSGTTGAVAQKMGRRWVMAERERDTIETFSAPRLAAVVNGSDEGGISSREHRIAVEALPDGVSPEDAREFVRVLTRLAPEIEPSSAFSADDAKAIVRVLKARAKTRLEREVNWRGGGGFRTLDVAPSMYHEEHGMVFLADWATASDLSEAVAAQLGFDYEIEGPFCGRKGRVRLAVVDGHVTRDVAKAIVDSLEKGETLSLVATSVDPDVDEALGKLRRGSRARVAPEDLLLQYAKPSNWRVSVAREPETKLDAEIEEEALATEGIS